MNGPDLVVHNPCLPMKASLDTWVFVCESLHRGEVLCYSCLCQNLDIVNKWLQSITWTVVVMELLINYWQLEIKEWHLAKQIEPHEPLPSLYIEATVYFYHNGHVFLVWRTRKFKKVQAKKLVKSNKSIFFREIAFFAVLNFFPVQKLIFGHFWNCKIWNLVKIIFS